MELHSFTLEPDIWGIIDLKVKASKPKKDYPAECLLFLLIQEGWRTKIFCHVIVTNVFFQKEEKMLIHAYLSSSQHCFAKASNVFNKR